MYELGVAHSFNKRTIIITQDKLSTLPFDLKQYRAKQYSTHFKDFADLTDYLNKNLGGFKSGEVIFSNPIIDFLDINEIKNVSLFSREEIKIDIEEGEKGFLDFLADIESDTEELTKKIILMTNDMDSMTRDVVNGTKEIERVNKTGGDKTASFVRKEAKKIATSIQTFSTNLNHYNQEYLELWNKTEKTFLDYLKVNIQVQIKTA